MGETRPTRFASSTPWRALALLPAVALGAIFALALWNRMSVGAWPQPNIHDPKDVNSVLYAVAITAYLLAVMGTIVLAVGLPLARRLRLSVDDAATLVLGLLGFAVLVYVLNGETGNWLMD